MAVHDVDIVVMGAGLQGAGIALELARRGTAVTLLDQDAHPMNRASLRNEGKIHLGLIYAASRDTAFLQLDGALRFRSSIARWLPAAEGIAVSTPFHYLVARDSLMTPDALAEHYAAIEARCRELLDADKSLDYMGTRPATLFRRLEPQEIAAHFDPDRFIGGFATAELAVDTDRLADAIRRAIASSPLVTFLPSHRVRTLKQKGDVFVVGGNSPAGAWQIEARQVVNATWERRLALDHQLGFEPPKDLLHRLKYRVLARVPDDLRHAPSVSMVLGRYGDVVVRPDGLAYLSWYPAGLRGWSHDIEPPADWDGPCRGETAKDMALEVERSIREGIADWYRGFARCQVVQVDAGAIVAIGRSDVDDAASGLHDRTRIGVRSRGGYHSADPGKLTTAPWFAVQVADRVQAFRYVQGLLA